MEKQFETPATSKIRTCTGTYLTVWVLLFAGSGLPFCLLVEENCPHGQENDAPLISTLLSGGTGWEEGGLAAEIASILFFLKKLFLKKNNTFCCLKQTLKSACRIVQ